jgi:hypothetical protein
MRRTPLERGDKPLQRGAPIPRAEMDRRPTERLRLSRQEYADIRQGVIERDGGSCVRCNVRIDCTHHRLARGMGGASRNPDVHDPAALLSMCDPCHRWVENNPDEAGRYGWIVDHGIIDLEDVVTRWHGQWVQLTHRCTVLANADPPPGELL